ncbi:MAG: hypothetical protein KGJ80_06265 [Chloroflexota bacterium]|nr:hypothetical protein [Chloroflexota bacterium]
MSTNWFFTQFPPSRHGIENELRLAFWKVGCGQMWITCTKDVPPYECDGHWHNQDFAVEWEPGNYLRLRMKEANEDLLDAFRRMLKHGALAAYKNGGGTVVVEWRVKDADARFEELQMSGARELERLDR